MKDLTLPQALVLVALILAGGALLYLGKSEQAVSLLIGTVGGWLIPSPKQ